MSLTSIHEDVGLIPGLAQWAKGSSVDVSCGVGHRCHSHSKLLRLWHRPAAAAPFRPLAWELPCVMSKTLKRKKKKSISFFFYMERVIQYRKIKINYKIPTLCLWSFKVTKICFQRPNSHLAKQNQALEQQSSENLPGPGTACCARDNEVSFPCGRGDMDVQLFQRMWIAADDQRVTTFQSQETWQGSQLWYVGDEMFPLLSEQRDRGLCTSAQMSMGRGARGLCFFGRSTNKSDK